MLKQECDEKIDWSKPFYTAQEVRLLLDVGDNTFRKWIRNGWISYTQIPGSNKMYIQKEHLIEFLNDGKRFYPRNVA